MTPSSVLTPFVRNRAAPGSIIYVAPDMGGDASTIQFASDLAGKLDISFRTAVGRPSARHAQSPPVSRAMTLSAAARAGIAPYGIFEGIRVMDTDDELPEFLSEKRTDGDGGASLVVLSGREWPRSMLGRSPSIRLARELGEPTLLANDPELLRAWVAGRRTLRVMVCVGARGDSDAIFEWAANLTSMGPCEIVLASMSWPVEEHHRVGADAPLSFHHHAPEVVDVLERELWSRARPIIGALPSSCRIVANTGDGGSCLLAVANEVGADLIVIGSRNRSWLSRFCRASVADRVAAHASCNVLLVPAVSVVRKADERKPELRHVLVPTDFSGVANGAIVQALRLFRRGGLMTLLHVVRSMPEGKRDRLDDTGERSSDETHYLRDVSARLRALVPSSAALHGVSVRCEVVVSDDTGLAISQAAERLGVDLICIGRRARSEIVRTVFGSISGRTASKARRPVMIVPEGPTTTP